MGGQVAAGKLLNRFIVTTEFLTASIVARFSEPKASVPTLTGMTGGGASQYVFPAQAGIQSQHSTSFPRRRESSRSTVRLSRAGGNPVASQYVFPAHAGIQSRHSTSFPRMRESSRVTVRLSRAGGNPVATPYVFPAQAGIQSRHRKSFHSH